MIEVSRNLQLSSSGSWFSSGGPRLPVGFSLCRKLAGQGIRRPTLTGKKQQVPTVRTSRPTMEPMKPSSAIIPPGFAVTAHRIFQQWKPPEPHAFLVDEAEVDLAPPVPPPSTSSSSSSSSAATTTAPPPPGACPICLSRFERPVTLVGCCHSFCHTCLQVWFKRRLLCPICSGTVHSGYVESSSSSNDGRRVAWKLWSVGGGGGRVSLEDAVVQHAMRHHAALVRAEGAAFVDDAIKEASHQ